MIKLHPIFRIREQATSEIVALLDSVTLGTNGAHYRHLDTGERIKEADNPIFLTMERNEKVMGNITFCRRDEDWYIRYFAFNSGIQSAGKTKTKSKSNNLLRVELENFFKQTLAGEYDGKPLRSHYAYIDPNNEKSLWMSENFQFQTIGHVATQTFSRANPKQSNRIIRSNNWDDVNELINQAFSDYNFFYDTHVKSPPYYYLKDEKGEIIAIAKTSIATWEIKRLPGKFGGVLTKMIPWIPVLRKLIRPANHSFIVPEAVYVKDNAPELLTELFEGILFEEKLNLLIWWVDQKAPTYQVLNPKMRWGLLHKLVGVSTANLVVRKGADFKIDTNQPFYTIGFDFI